MNKNFIQIGGLFGLFSVLLGAFAAHALKEKLTAPQLQIFETAVRYQFYHAFALILVGILYKDFSNKFINLSGYFFIVGIILFSGSLYALSNIDSMKWIGIITPFGGLCFIIGWLLIILGCRNKIF